MNQHTAIIATDAVGAAAGGLVRDGRNGLVVPAGDAARSPPRCGRWRAIASAARALGAAGREDVARLHPRRMGAGVCDCPGW